METRRRRSTTPNLKNPTRAPLLRREKQKMTHVDGWSKLPLDILTDIAQRLIDDVKDCIRLGAVCKQWHYVYMKRIRLPHQPPVLMLPTPLDSKGRSRSFYRLTDDKLYYSQLLVPHSRYCSNSTHGWLVTVNNKYDVRLLNPFMSIDNEICLPSLTTLVKTDQLHNPRYLKKAILSANPSSTPNYVIMIIYGPSHRLAFSQPGDKAWSKLHPEYKHIWDLICYGDKIYFVDKVGGLFVFDLNHPSKVSSTATPPQGEDGVYHDEENDERYLVESSGDLLLVLRQMEFRPYSYSTLGFLIFKLDPVRSKWIEVNSLCGRAVFVGDNSSFSLSVSDSPGCQPNCIYFTDDLYEHALNKTKPHDKGVFNLANMSLERHYPIGAYKMGNPPPIWIEPTLQQGRN